VDLLEEFAYGHLGIILIESREKPGFQVNPRIDGAAGQTPEPIKGHPLRVPKNCLSMMASLFII